MSWPPLFEYTALPDRSIRLLQLLPGAPGSPLTCSLCDERLDNPNIEYKALSYCWGEEHPQSPLFIADSPGDVKGLKQLPIRPNLAAALSQLRTNILACCDPTCTCQDDSDDDATHPVEDCHFTRPANIWIDAVCINQTDLTERSHQVALMYEIYTRATTIIAWLGPADAYTLSALRMIYALARLPEACPDDQDNRDNEEKRHNIDITPARRHLGVNPAFTPFWIALGHFFADNDWWERIWIVQEIVLAKRVIMVVGPWGMTWSQLVKAQEVFHRDGIYEQLCDATLPSGEFAHMWPVIAGFLKVGWLESLRNLVSGTVTMAGETAALMTMLSWAFRYKATNSRDKVYGILGVLKGLGVTLPIEPRDDISVCEVYMHAAKLIHDQTGDLLFLEAVENNRVPEPVRRFDLPSWTPDFAAPNNLLPISWARLADEAALHRQSWNPHWSGGERDLCKFNISTRTVTVRGFRMDTIHRFNNTADGAGLSSGSAPKFEDIVSSRNVQKRIDCVVSDEGTDSKTEETWRALLGPELEEGRRWIPAKEGIAANDDRGPATRHFQTRHHGFVSFTQVEACVGDEVCWLIGLGFPCILRRQGNAWRYIGVCHSLQGLPSGLPNIQELKYLAVANPGMFTCQEFAIR
ncbi:heterokaryon incompatibility protein-domain-containing protein [Cercophora newfieldiana]|uniref:Heterokaryon incompatibility protein-domain-containing protein n=1 Tax=Cercophora newfieldiana TaxID=92897 RepID=A0AA39YCC0_9PEZI|nr:heterokaryon incompatibility protein-domain-containing protein [Cercophora newfieldiana]